MNKIIVLSLILLGLLSGALYFNAPVQTDAPIQKHNRNFLGQANQQLTLTYEFNTQIQTSTATGDLSTTQENIVNTASKAKFTPVYNPASHTYTVMVDYENIVIHKGTPMVNEEITEFQYATSSQEQIGILYIVTVHADTGKILSMSRSGGEQDEIIDQITKLQIQQIFPNIRRAQPHLLSDAELIEETELGDVFVRTEVTETQEGQILEKYYTEEDIMDDSKLSWTEANGESQVSFQEIIVISDPTNGIVTSGKSYFDFVYEVDLPELSQAEGDEQQQSTDIFGDMEAHYETELTILEQFHDSEYQLHVQEIALNMVQQPETYETVDIRAKQPEVFINDLSDEAPEWEGANAIPHDQIEPEVLEQLLSQSVRYQKDYDVVSQKILGKTLIFRVEYRNYGEMSNVQGNIMIDSRVLKTVFSYSYKHCAGSYERNYNQQYNLDLFTVSYPILAIISVTANAQLTVDYGFNFYYGPMSQAHGCEVTVAPYVKPALTVNGGVSAVVAKGGIYARGTVVNTEMKFASHIQGFIPNLSGAISLKVEVKPFEVSVGAWYQIFGCEWKKIFKWLPSFNKVCGYGNRHEYQIYSYGVGRTNYYTIFDYNWKM